MVLKSIEKLRIYIILVLIATYNFPYLELTLEIFENLYQCKYCPCTEIAQFLFIAQ